MRFTLLVAFIGSQLFLGNLAQQTNCSSGLVSCGPSSLCCPTGTTCNFNRGIPWCELDNSTAISGFDDSSCGGDPFLFDCKASTDISGFCCPVGTICYNGGQNEATMSCIDALGSISSATPSSTSMDFLPSATPVPTAAFQLGPNDAWNELPTDLNCHSSTNTMQVTDVINSTISLNFTGPSILINTVSSPNGGVFSMIFDGVLLKDTVDTYNADGERCYVRQFPPFVSTPTDLASTSQHSLVLMYSGPSEHAPEGSSAIIQFNAFAIPQFTTATTAENEASKNNFRIFSVLMSLIFVGWSIL